MKYETICCIAAIFCVALALAGNIAVAAVLLVACTLCSIAASKVRRAGANAVDRDAVQFIDSVLENYSDSASTLGLLEKSLNDRFAFCKDMQRAIRTYRLSSNARQAFSVLLGYNSYAMKGIVSAVTSRLDNGACLRMQFLELRKHIAQRNGNELKNTRTLGSLLSVTRIGAILFFPIFAGISLNILKFTAIMQSSGSPSAQALTAVFAFFISYSNMLNFKYDMRESATVRAQKSALSCAVAIFVFKIASALSIGML